MPADPEAPPPDRLLADLVVLAVAQMKLVLWSNIGVAAIVALVPRLHGDGWAVPAWAALVMLLTLVRALSLRHMKPLLGEPDAAAGLRGRLRAGTLASGIVWGTLGLVAAPGGAPVDLLFVTLVLSGMTAGSVASHSALPGHYPLFAVPAMIPLVLRFALGGGEYGIPVAMLGAMFLAVNLGYGTRQGRMVAESVALRFERRDLLARLVAEKRHAEDANRAKSRFLADISHDMRQPLHAMGLFASGLGRHVQGEGHPLLDGMGRALAALDVMLQSLIDMAKIEAGIVRANPAPTRLSPLLRQIALETAAPAREKGLDLRVLPCSATILTDPHLLARILRNLATNAVRYTARGRIVIGCRRGASWAGGGPTLMVADTGVGIAEERIGDIFREFNRGQRQHGQDQGLGLGLAIAQGLAECLGSRVLVRSALGRGSVFAVPLEASTAAEEPPPPEPVAAQVAGRRILVVDDEAVIREATARILEGWGCAVAVAATMEEALALLDRQGTSPDAVLLDLRLGGAARGETLLRLIDERLGRPMPAILVTGDLNVRTTPPREGRTLLLHKPASPLRLRAGLGALFAADPT